MWPPGAITSALLLLCVYQLAAQRLAPFSDEQIRHHQSLLKQYKSDKINGFARFHELPEESSVPKPQKFEKVAALDGFEHCPHGYTGQLCDIPICQHSNRLVHHSGSTPGELIELEFFDQCAGSNIIHVDDHIQHLKISVTTERTGFPNAKLYNAYGRQIRPQFEIPNPHVREIFFENIIEEGAGKYVIVVESADNEDCTAAVFAATDLVIDGGFVESVHDDNVQQFASDAHELQRDPTEHIPSYLAFGTTNLEYPETLNTVTFYRSNFSTQYAPLHVGSRYNCEANAFVGPYVCLEHGIYFVKIRGYDQGGNIWQRMYQYACNVNPHPGPGPGPTPPPPPPPESCENGGTLVHNNTHNYCYCGHHYGGRRCEFKICDHGGHIGHDGNCVCYGNFGGEFCEHVTCPKRSGRQFTSDKTALNFVVRSHDDSNIRAQVTASIDLIVNTFVSQKNNEIEAYTATFILDGETKLYLETDRAEEFLKQINEIEGHWEKSDRCNDSIFLAIDEALEIGAATHYRNSPIIVFTDALPNDPLSTRFDILQRLNKQNNPIHIITYGGKGYQCNPDLQSEKYEELRILAQYSGGLVTKATAHDEEQQEDSIGRVAFTLAMGLFQEHLLAANDLLDSCRYAPNEQVFFVDDSIEQIVVAFVGRNDYKIHVVDTVEEEIQPYYHLDQGDLFVSVYRKLEYGNYRLIIQKPEGNSTRSEVPCHYRVYARTKYEVFTGAAFSIENDIALEQPMLNQEMHIVARINNVEFPDRENVFAEALIWHNDLRQHDKREVLYASNGIYRDGCDYNLYFGTWKCTQPNQFFYIEVYAEDATGLTVKRTSVGHCTVRDPQPPDQYCRNGGVRVGDKCLCVPGYQGDRCENIVCYNGGRSEVTHCKCYAPWTGRHCEEATCQYQNHWTNFKPKDQGLSLIIQGSSDVRSTLIDLSQISHDIVRDIKYNDPQWIQHYSILTFTNETVKKRLDTDHPDDLLHVLEDVLKESENAKSACQDLLIYEAIIEALSTSRAMKNDIVYIIVSGGIKRSADMERRAFELIDMLGAKINIIQSPINKCNINLEAEESADIVQLAHYSGGEHFLTNSGKALLTIPLQYDNGIVYDEVRDGCEEEQTFYFPIGGEAQTVSVITSGDLRRGYPKITAVEGQYVDDLQIYASTVSNLHVIYKDCPDGWQAYKQNCYLFELLPHTWDDAKTTCIYQGGHILHVSNAEINNLMSAATGGQETWIGLNDQNSHAWGWDQGTHPDMPLTEGSYKNWASGEPKDGNHCATLTSEGWKAQNCTKSLPIICQKHAYELGYNPGGQNTGHLPRGVWQVKLQTYKDYNTCGVRVNVQSATQVFRQFTKKVDDDWGDSFLIHNSQHNKIIAHLESSIHGERGESKLEYAHLYPSVTANLGDVVSFNRREQCSYEYVSHDFTAKSYGYYIGYTGFDAYGYPFQRILPAVAESTIPKCVNGGILDKRTEECVCPPNFRGRECQIPDCKFGYPAPNMITCRCYQGYAGDFCQHAVCTRNDTGHQPPPLHPEGKSLVFVLDGSTSGPNGAVVNNFTAIINEVLDRLGDIPTQWFTNYVGIVAYDEQHDSPSSAIVSEKTRAKFLSEMKYIFSKGYQPKNNKREYLHALSKVVRHKDVAVGSPVYIIGNAVVGDHRSRYDHVMDFISQKHVTIHSIILEDNKVPGGEPTYYEPAVETLIGLTYVTDGQFYQVPASKFVDLFYLQLGTRFRGYGLTHQTFRQCSEKYEYFQTGGDFSLLVIDIFSVHYDTNFDIIDPDGKTIVSFGIEFLTITNRFFTLETNKPGIWTIQIGRSSQTHPCVVSVREVAKSAPSIGFSRDLESDQGRHSRSAQYYPEHGLNAILANSEDYLTYAQVYSHDEHTLVFSSPLIRRIDCNWNYISTEPFRCPSLSFTVAVEAYDKNGHPYRRTYKTHCVGFEAPNQLAIPSIFNQTDVAVPKLAEIPFSH
ncbi:unnamed protein product [Bursaphelenchus okinawaensis]|uniref:Uncharacterized protein n=1 Tax=Bursaphelenchus okinawaensis TaxID=465554 RepID=A0A811LLX0_9BILA|nr:unnamed protein product [Bursaphelenchus okinawaensis]CAG9124128.1 unnamed protein product [Bursaphelenchus okinawaensis]